MYICHDKYIFTLMQNSVSHINFRKIFDDSEECCKIGYDAMYSKNVEILKTISNVDNKSYFTFVFFEKGEFVFKVNSLEYRITAPAILSISFDVKFEIISYKDDSSLIFFVSSDSLRKNLFNTFIDELSVETKIKYSPFFVLDEEGRSFIFRHVEDMKGIFSDTTNSYRLNALKYLMSSAFYQFFYKLYNHNEENDYGIPSKFLELLEMNFIEWRQSKLYADYMGISNGHLDFVLKRKMEKTAKTLIDERIVKEAKRLLKESSLSIEQIAKELRFSSIEIFSRFFKRVAGVSPSKFRR